MDARELQRRIDEIEPGGEVALPPGRIEGPIIIRRALTLVGAGPEATILDAGGRSTVVSVDARDDPVVLRNLGVHNGRSRRGGGISIDNGAKVELVECHLIGNAGPAGRGGALSIDRGAVTVVRCLFRDNTSDEGGAVYVGGDAEALLRDCLLAQNSAERGGGLAIYDGARVRIERTRLDENQASRKGHHLFTYGSSARRPRISLLEVTFGEVSAEGPSVVNDSDFKAEIELEQTVWPEDSTKTAKPRRRRFTLH